MPVQIDVVDSTVRPDNGFLADHRRAHPRAVRSHDVLSMVLGVLARAADQPISRLRIFGHGRQGQQNVGGGTLPDVTEAMFVEPNVQPSRGRPAPGELWNRGILQMLNGHFTPDAIVELHGCRVGTHWEGSILLWQLSQLWRVRVRAGLARQVSDAADRFEDSSYVEGDGRPGALQPIVTRHR